MISNHSKGVLLMLIGVLIVPWLDGFAKLLGQTLPVLEVTWARFAVQFLLVSPFAIFRLGNNLFKFRQWKLQILRGFLLVLASTLFFASLRTLKIADAIAVFFIHPLLTVLISHILLKEKVEFKKLFSVFIGFNGALLVIKPGMENFDWNSIFALGTGFCFSGYVILGRHLSKDSSPFQALLITGFVGTIILSVPQQVIWVQPQGKEWGWVFAMGVIGMIGHYFIIKALEYVPASKLAPLGYFEIIGSIMVGMIIFNEIPDLTSVCGIIIIILSGLFISKI